MAGVCLPFWVSRGIARIFGALHAELLRRPITAAAGKLTFETKKTGSTDEISALGFEYKDSTGVNGIAPAAKPTGGVTEIDCEVRKALTDGIEIKASDITLYNGKNYEDAVFTINGKKFVVMVPDEAGANLGAGSPNMNATQGLGSDVTILVAEDTTNKGLTTCLLYTSRCV